MEGKEGYDSSVTMYSPDGRMYQVEYAREAIKRGITTCGLVYKDGVLLLVEKKIRSKLLDPKSIEKIFKIDRYIGCSMSGLVADARVLVDDVRSICQDEKYFYGEYIRMSELVKKVSNMIWHQTYDGGTRPLGISLLIGGIDESGPHIYSTDPSGAFQELKAGALGEHASDVEQYMTDNYKPGLTFIQALDMLLKAMEQNREDKPTYLELCRVKMPDGVTIFGNEELQQIIKTRKEP